MSDFEIARNFGATAFLVYHIIKASPNICTRDLIMESGLDRKSVKKATDTLAAIGAINNNPMVTIYKASKNSFTVKEEVVLQ